MKYSRTQRGFDLVEHPTYPACQMGLLVQESSATDGENDPGESFLWVGDAHHLDRVEVAELIERLQAWLQFGSLMSHAEAENDV